MKRTQVLKTIREAAKAAGLEYHEVELANHTGVVVGGLRRTIGRHREVDEITVRKFYKQFEEALGEGWWK
jgi:hypothetical protein